jgi:hypothetical protein
MIFVAVFAKKAFPKDFVLERAKAFINGTYKLLSAKKTLVK